MSEQNNNNQAGWNEVPANDPVPIEPTPPQETEPRVFEELNRLHSYQERVEDSWTAAAAPPNFAAPDSNFSAQPLPPVPPTIPIYDPVLDEREPYAAVSPENEGFCSAPVYTAPAMSYQAPAEKKNKNWTIALIVLLVLCVCLLLGLGIILVLVASGKYEIQWSYLMLELFRQVV